MQPRTPLHSKTAISLFMAASRDLSFRVLHSGNVRDDLIASSICSCKTTCWNRVEYHQEFYYFNCYPVFSSNPEYPGFCPHTNPGLRVWKSEGLPRFSGSRVAFPSGEMWSYFRLSHTNRVLV